MSSSLMFWLVAIFATISLLDPIECQTRFPARTETVTWYEPIPTGAPLVSSNVGVLTVMASMVFMAVVIIIVLALFNQVDCCNTTA